MRRVLLAVGVVWTTVLLDITSSITEVGKGIRNISSFVDDDTIALVVSSSDELGGETTSDDEE